jgi:hypothetical protein
MPQPLNTARLEEALTLLAERLKLTAAEPQELGRLRRIIAYRPRLGHAKVADQL